MEILKNITKFFGNLFNFLPKNWHFYFAIIMKIGENNFQRKFFHKFKKSNNKYIMS